MKLIIIILLLLGFMNQSYAKKPLMDVLNELPRKERTAKFNEEIGNVPDNKKFFIPANTLRCSSRISYKKGVNYVINHNGSVDRIALQNLGCAPNKGWSIGFILGYEKDSRIIKVIHTWLGSNHGTLQSYFNIDDLMTVEQRKNMTKNFDAALYQSVRNK